jgi:hypothetical protein
MAAVWPMVFGERLEPGAAKFRQTEPEVLPECQSENTLRRQIFENDGHEK